jgi:hypothetical protein
VSRHRGLAFDQPPQSSVRLPQSPFLACLIELDKPMAVVANRHQQVIPLARHDFLVVGLVVNFGSEAMASLALMVIPNKHSLPNHPPKGTGQVLAVPVEPTLLWLPREQQPGFLSLFPVALSPCTAALALRNLRGVPPIRERFDQTELIARLAVEEVSFLRLLSRNPGVLPNTPANSLPAR